MKKYALIMAAGEGRRAGGELPKQFAKLLGIPALWWSVSAFHKEDLDTRIIIVLHPGFFDDFEILHAELPEDLRKIPFKLVCGGRTRGDSVANGLMSVEDSQDALVAVHDAARPMVTPEMISRGWKCARKNRAAVPVVPVTDTLRRLTPEGSETVDRSQFVSVQTPQVFNADLLHRAYRLEDQPHFTDDASRVEALGIEVALYDGQPDNIKVTNPMDFTIAEALLRQSH